MNITTILKSLTQCIGVIAIAVAAAITFGGPSTPKPLSSINDPFKSVDFSDLPPLLRYKASDGTDLAYRAYTPRVGIRLKGSVVLVHGSSGSSNSMHVVAKALANAGYSTYALDIRGHGASGPKGHIAFVGQLEDDLASFVQAVPLIKPSTLIGFSSGGGFVLRFAGSPRQELFERYVLLSPFLGSRSPSYRPNSGGWVDVGIPRIVSLMALNHLGVQVFNELPVINFALNEESKKLLTPTYSFNLAINFGPQQDFETNIRAVHQPVRVVAGASDEAFKTDKLEGIFRQQGQAWPVTLLPGINHIGLTLNASAVNAIVAAVDAM